MIDRATASELRHPRVAAPASGAYAALRILLFLVSGLAALTFLVTSVPGTYFPVLIVLPVAWIGLAVAWLGSALLVAHRAGVRALLKNRLLLATALIPLATAGGVAADVPLQARFAASRPSMEALAAELAPTGTSLTHPDRWIGLFDAERIEEFAGGYRFLVKGTGLIAQVGFAYRRDGPPPNISGEDLYTPFNGHWWIWVEDW